MMLGSHHPGSYLPSPWRQKQPSFRPASDAVVQEWADCFCVNTPKGILVCQAVAQISVNCVNAVFVDIPLRMQIILSSKL